MIYFAKEETKLRDAKWLVQCRRHNAIPDLGKSPGRGNCNPLQYSCLGNRRDRGAWGTTVHKAANSQTCLKQLSMHVCLCVSMCVQYSRNTGMRCCALLQGIFPPQGLNLHLLGLLHWQVSFVTTSTTWESQHTHTHACTHTHAHTDMHTDTF